MKFFLAAALYLSIGHMATDEIAKVYPSVARSPLRQAALLIYWPVPLIRMNVEHVLGQRPPRSRQWKGSV